MYATQTDIETRLDPKHLIELADDNSDGTPDSPVIDAAIVDADAFINSHLASRYTLPINPVPALLRKISTDIAIANLFARRRESASPLHEVRAKAAVRIVRSLACGEVLLPDSAQLPRHDSPDSTTRGVSKAFSRETLVPY